MSSDSFLVTMVANASGKQPKPVSAEAVINAIKNGEFREQIRVIRHAYEQALASSGGDHKAAKESIAELKRNLPGIMWSGVFSARGDKNLTTYSQLFCADLDHLEKDQIVELLDRMWKDPHIVTAFSSPTATGIKLVFRVLGGPEQHKTGSFRAVQKYVRDTYGLEIDEQCKNLERLCFVSDGHAFYNLDSIPLEPLEVEPAPCVTLATGIACDGSRREIAERILGSIDWQSDTEGLCQCPGMHLHTTGNGKRDCKVMLNGVPTVSCFHSSCNGILAGINHTLRSRIGKSERKSCDPINALQDSRPKVQLPGDNHLLSDCADSMGKILAGKDIFSRGGRAFTLNERKDGLSLMKPEILRTWIEDYLVCYKIKNVGGNDTLQFTRTISETDASGILASPQFIKHLKPIERLNPVRIPIMRGDGSIELLTEGYDELTKSFTCDAAPFSTAMAFADAKHVIDELLSEFTFADSGRSKAVSVSAMLTVFAIGLLSPKTLRPCFIYLANAEGAGKTLLVKCATVPVLGDVQAETKPDEEAEMRKSLLVAVMEAHPVIFFDNTKKHIASAALEGFLTNQDYAGRILGKSESFRGENNAVVFITGNGCTVSPDMRRRSLFCELFLETERAEDRKFQNSLEVPALLERRSEILAALWALIREWDKAMRPKPSRSNSSFPDWAKIIGGIVEHAGYGCPLETPQIEAAADTEGTDMRKLVRTVADGERLKTVEFANLVATARAEGLFERLMPGDDEQLDAKAKATFAQILKRYDKRLVGGYRFTLIGKGRNRCFQVEEVNKL